MGILEAVDPTWEQEPLRLDRDVRGVYRMFNTFCQYALPSLTDRQIFLLWHACRGVTTEEGWITTCYNGGFPVSLSLIKSDWIAVFQSLGLYRKMFNRTREQAIRDLLPAAVRSVWGLYTLAWGKPTLREI